MFKLFIVAVLLLIILQMGWGLKAMYRKESKKEDMVRALTWRVSCSIGVFLLLLIGMQMGWITPN